MARQGAIGSYKLQARGLRPTRGPEECPAARVLTRQLNAGPLPPYQMQGALPTYLMIIYEDYTDLPL